MHPHHVIPAWVLPVTFPICSFQLISVAGGMQAWQRARAGKSTVPLRAPMAREARPLEDTERRSDPRGSPNSRKEWYTHSWKVLEWISRRGRGRGDSKCVFGGDSGVLGHCFHDCAWLSGFLLIHESVSICMFVQEISHFMEIVTGLSLEPHTVSRLGGVREHTFFLASAPVCLCSLSFYSISLVRSLPILSVFLTFHL